eukprot:98150-Amphidinium_carterae.2
MVNILDTRYEPLPIELPATIRFATGWCSMARRCLLAGKPQQDLRKCYKVTTAALPGHLAPPDYDHPEQEAHPDDDDTIAPHDRTHACPVCQKTFATNAGLCTHKMRAHDLIPPLSLRVRGTSCISCGSQLGTRVRLLNHLQERISCGLYVIANVEPMDLTEYRNSVSSLNAENNLLSRELPRTGPITLTAQGYVSQPVIALNPFEDSD